MKTTIVTAFFDIGRSEWTQDKGLPHYLHRPTDVYMERFSHLAKLDNEMIIYTTEDLAEKISSYRQDKPTKVIVVPFKEMFTTERETIAKIQSSESYKSQIEPSQKSNPEYWSVDYVLVNMLKSTFVNHAIENEMTDNAMISWVDFGYCRSEDALGGLSEWQPELNEEKIHLFQLKKYDDLPMSQIIFNNIVYIVGGVILARQDNWVNLMGLVSHSLKQLTDNNMIDDDQILLLMASLLKPELFELHPIENWDAGLEIFKRFQ